MLSQVAGGGIAKIAAAGLSFLISVQLARYLGPEVFGVYAMTMSVIGILTAITTLGLPTLIVREVATFVANGQWGLLKGILYRSYQWVAIAITLTIVFGLITINFLSSNWQLALLLGLIILPLLVVNQLRASILRGLHWVVLADLPELILRPSIVLVLIYGWASFSNVERSSEWAVGIQLIASIISFVVGTWLLRKRLPGQLLNVVPIFENKVWLAASVTFLGVSLVSVVESQVALLLLGVIDGPKYAGLYQAAFQLVTLIVFGLMAVNMALQSKFAAAWSMQKKQLAQSLVTVSARLGMYVALVFSSVLLYYSEECLALFGDGYVEASTALRILVLGQLINAASGSCGTVLAMTGHQIVVLHGVTLALLVNTLLCLILVPMWGLTGAATAASSGLIVWNLYLMFKAKQLTGITTSIVFGKDK